MLIELYNTLRRASRSEPRRATRSLLYITLLAFSAGIAGAVPTSTSTVTAATPTLRINEVLATNTLITNGNTRPDMIELHNAGSAAVDLSGKRLVDSTEPAIPFVFPNGTSIPAGGYLIVYADSSTTAPGLHLGWGLDAEGDRVRLLESTANGGQVIDEIQFGFQIPNFSISRTGAGANIWALTAPTMGAANGSPVSLAAPGGVKVNEWAGKIVFRLDHDLIELYNPAAQPVALGGVRLTDDVARPTRFTFPQLSFIGGSGYLPLFGADFIFGLDGDRETITLFGENNEQIDQVTLQSQVNDRSNGRAPDGAATISEFAVPTPGISNTTPLPPAYAALLANLRITEIMYDPIADDNASQFEFIELQNVGSTTLDLNGVRFTNGLEHTFQPGETLAPGAFLVVANDRSSFRARYPQVPDSVLAQGGFNGSLSNDGETIALTLPAPWDVHILRFRFEPTWVPSASRGGRSIVPVTPAATPPQNWQVASTWRASAANNGSPGTADPASGSSGGSSATARLSNLSVRTAMAAGQNLIVGFYVDGGARNLLVRAAGPGLTALGVPGAMADPRLELYLGSSTIATLSNDDWNASLAPTFASVGAFGFPAGSRDSAFVQSISANGSVHARGTGPGIILVEAYDLGEGNSPRLTNVSARNRVGTGDNILIAGFNIAGTGAKQLLIRAVGPKLATFGITDFLVNPKLELYSGEVKLNENEDWAAALAATFTAVGAFGLDAGSRDAALLTTLQPGPYTVQVRGSDGGVGEALIEIYEVP